MVFSIYLVQSADKTLIHLKISLSFNSKYNYLFYWCIESKSLSTKTSSLSRSVYNRNPKKSCSPLSVIYGHSLSNGKSVNTTHNQNSPKLSSKLNEKNKINGSLNGNSAHNGNGYSVSILFPKEVTQQYEIGQIIGDGNFAVVHQCCHKATKTQFALKIINKSKCKGKEAMIASEVAILRKVKHTNIIQLLDDFDYTNELYLVMELVKVCIAMLCVGSNSLSTLPVLTFAALFQSLLLSL